MKKNNRVSQRSIQFGPKVIAPVVVLVAGLLTSAGLVWSRPAPESDLPTKLAPIVRVLQVETGEAEFWIHAQGTVEPRTEIDLVIEVADNGLGFDPPDREDAQSPERGGFGLKNVRDRFQGYFGDDAQLSTSRDEKRGLTIARLVES